MADKTNWSQNSPRIAWPALIWVILLLFLAVQAARLALVLGRWPEPIRYASVVVLLVMLGLIWQGVKKLWRWGRTLTLKRAIIGFMLIFTVTVFFVGINNPSEDGPSRSFQDAAITVSRTAGKTATNGFWAVVRFPSQMWIAYTGHSMFDSEKGNDVREPTVVNDENLPAVEIPSAVSLEALTAELGDEVLTSSQAASLCKMAALSSDPFPPDTRVIIIEGPRLQEDEWWWRVQSETAAGWCPESALAEIEK